MSKEIVASSAAYKGSLAVWDARGFDIPSGRREDGRSKKILDYNILDIIICNYEMYMAQITAQTNRRR